MQSIFLHYSKEVVPVQMALFVGVDSGKGVMDREGVGTSKFLLGQLDLLLADEMHLEALEEIIASLLCEVILLGDLLHVDVLWLSNLHSVGIIWILGSEALAKI